MSERYSREELLDSLVALADETGRSPTIGDLEDADQYPSPWTYKERFGSWNAAKAEVGLDTSQKGEREYAVDELIGYLQSLAEELGRPPAIHDLKEADEYPSPQTYYDRFESWILAKELAGLDTNNQGTHTNQRFSDAELIEYLQELHDELDTPPSKQDLDRTDEYPSSTTYEYHFGTWNKARKAAGILPDTEKKETGSRL